MKEMPLIPLRGYIWVWLGLVLFVLLTVASSFLRLGGLNLAVSLGISFLKTSLVLWYCMNLRGETSLTRLFASAGFCWLLLLFVFSLADVVTR
jgi:cytochrome c oxidase subunit 4